MTTTERYLIWFVASAVAAAAVAWIAFTVQQEGIAPAILFPLLVGGVLGGALVAIRRAIAVPGVRVAVATAALWGLLVVVGQDYIGHRHRLALYHEQLARQAASAALAAPEIDALEPSFFGYLEAMARREPVWWTLDLVLSAGAAAGVTVWGARVQRPATSPGA